MNSKLKVLLALLLALLCPVFALAQGASTGDLHVTVTAREQNKGFERATTLNNDGEYRLLSLPPGMYTVTVSAPGFGKYETADQQVTVGQMRDLPVTLQVGSVQT